MSSAGETLPIPVPAAPWTALLSVPRQGRRWPGAARAASAVALPGLIGLACGAGSAAAVAALGAFAVVYGEGKPYRVRWRAVALVGAVLIVLAAIGAAVGSTVHHALAAGGSALWPMLLVAVMTIVVAAAAFVVDALRLGAPGAFLLLLAVVIASTLPAAGVPVPAVVGWTAIGAVSALVVAMSGAVIRPRTPERAAVAAAVTAVDAVLEQDSPDHRREAVRSLHSAWQCLHDAGLVETDHSLTRTLRAAHVRCAAVLHGSTGEHESAAPEDDLWAQIPLRRPSIRHRLARAAHLRGRTTTVVVRLLVACPVAGLTAVLLGVGRPDWAVITTAMILHQGPDRVLGTYRAAHRFVGTVLGLVLLAGLSLLDLHGATLVVVLAALMAGIEAFLVRHYGLAMAAITPLAMILGALGSPALGTASRDRFLETVIGVAIALAVMWAVLPRAYRRILVDADSRVADTITRIATCASDSDRAELRRDLEFDLHASTTAAIAAAHTDREWTSPRWAEHRRLHERGYRVLTPPVEGGRRTAR